VAEVLVLRHEGNVAKVIKEIGASHRPRCLMGRFHPPREEYGGDGWAADGSTEYNHLTGWAEALSALRHVAAPSRHREEIAERAKEIGGREYLTFSHGWDASLALERIGQGLALLDGGLPGKDAMAFMGAFQTQVAARIMRDRLEDIAAVRNGLREGGHVDEDTKFEFNELDNRLHLTREGDHDVIWVDDQNGRLMVVLRQGEQGIDRLALARIDAPGAPAPAEIARLLSDPGATADGLSFDGFVGTFSVMPGGVEPIIPSALSSRVVKDAVLLSVAMGGGSISLAEERAPEGLDGP
jgi:hypothetical protein